MPMRRHSSPTLQAPQPLLLLPPLTVSSDLSACYGLLQHGSWLIRCSSVSCMLLCRGGVAAPCRWCCQKHRLRPLQQADSLPAAAQTAWRRQSAQGMHHANQPSSCCPSQACSSLATALRDSAADSKATTTKGSTRSSHRSAPSDWCAYRGYHSSIDTFSD
jgi:hypothetical protein